MIKGDDSFLNSAQQSKNVDEDENILIGSALETEAFTKHGNTVPILLTINENKIQGKILYTSFIKDITHQKQIEAQAQTQLEELKAQEEELRQNMEELTATQEEIERKSVEMNGLIRAVNSTLATIEFNLNGEILSANENFLNTMGYSLSEIKGRHHKIFISKEYAESEEYKKFWDDLKTGLPQLGEVKRIAKDGHDVWLNASYTPVLDHSGKPIKIIKFAQDITNQKR